MILRMLTAWAYVLMASAARRFTIAARRRRSTDHANAMSSSVLSGPVAVSSRVVTSRVVPGATAVVPSIFIGCIVFGSCVPRFPIPIILVVIIVVFSFIPLFFAAIVHALSPSVPLFSILLSLLIIAFAILPWSYTRFIIAVVALRRAAVP